MECVKPVTIPKACHQGQGEKQRNADKENDSNHSSLSADDYVLVPSNSDSTDGAESDNVAHVQDVASAPQLTAVAESLAATRNKPATSSFRTASSAQLFTSPQKTMVCSILSKLFA